MSLINLGTKIMNKRWPRRGRLDVAQYASAGFDGTKTPLKSPVGATGRNRIAS